jgi:hypothetical protein
MPQINLKQPGQPVADFSVSGSSVTVAGITIDCEARQLDSAVTVEIRTNKTDPSEGAIEGGNGAYLAQIEIPARRYTDVEGKDKDGEPEITQAPVPLDPNAISITLWPAA